MFMKQNTRSNTLCVTSLSSFLSVLNAAKIECTSYTIMPARSAHVINTFTSIKNLL